MVLTWQKVLESLLLARTGQLRNAAQCSGQVRCAVTTGGQASDTEGNTMRGNPWKVL